jgi:hypothetical protein
MSALRGMRRTLGRVSISAVPRPPKYPLEPLLEHRERRVEDATAELGDAVRAVEQAEIARARAEAERMAEEKRAERILAAESDLLAKGELRAVDLARAQAWEHGERARLAELAAAEGRAAGAVDAARGAEQDARAALAQKKADRDVVAKDEARFVDARKREHEAREEEAAEEAWGGGRRDR